MLSEVGMLPMSLVGLNEKKFKQFNNLYKNKYFVNTLLTNVANIYDLVIKNKYNSIVLNYDEKSDDFFKWYQQLVAESLGKKEKEFCQLYLQCLKIIIVLCNYTWMEIKIIFLHFLMLKRKIQKNQNNWLKRF